MVRNFLFHRVSSEPDALWDPMHPDLFEKCLSYISKNYSLITVEDIPYTTLTEKHATISFDDGYKDNIEIALPLLEKYKIKASFYVITDCIDKQIPTWTYYLEHLFKNTRKTNLEMDFSFLPGEYKTRGLTTKALRIQYVKKLKPLLKKVTYEQLKQVLTYIQSIYNDVALPDVMMSWDDLRKLRGLGHNIGSHTVSHPMLGTITNESILHRELTDSRERIFKVLGFYPAVISYPAGSYNPAVIASSKQSGYQLGLAVKQDVYHPNRDTIFEIPRIELYNEPWWKTRLRITNSLEQIKKALRYK